MPGFLAESSIKLKRTFTNELGGMLNTEKAEIIGRSLADIRQIGKFCDASAINLVRTHGG